MRNFLRVPWELDFLKILSNQNAHSFYIHFHFKKNTLWKNLSSQPLDMCILWECVHVHAVVCTCMYLCAHPCGFTLKHTFFIAFKLPSHFYIIFTLISLFSLSGRPVLKIGKFSKKPVASNSIKIRISHCINIFCLLISIYYWPALS